jgi:hypothetical protein
LFILTAVKLKREVHVKPRYELVQKKTREAAGHDFSTNAGQAEAQVLN